MSTKKNNPVEVIDEVCCGKDECESCPILDVADVAPEPVAAPVAKTYVAADGDTYASVAAKHKPLGTTKHEYAKRLFELNQGKALAAGTEVVL